MKKFELAIPKPCHENWNGMTPEEKGRFCGACQKTVIDFSQMSDRQVAQFFKQPTGSVCGRFSGDQLNRVIEVPRKRIPWVKYFFTISLPAFLWSLKAGAQGEVTVKGRVVATVKPATTDKRTNEKVADRVLAGKVVDESGNPIPSATILIKGEGYTQSFFANEKGEFQIHLKEQEIIEVTVSAVGFDPRTLAFSVFSANEPVTIRLYEATSRKVIVTMGMVVQKPAEKAPEKTPEAPLKKQIKKDSVISGFSVYPNPAATGKTFTIDPQKLDAGEYLMQVLNSMGEVLYTKKLQVEKDIKCTNMEIPVKTAGPYYIRLINKANNKSFTEILIVE